MVKEGTLKYKSGREKNRQANNITTYHIYWIWAIKAWIYIE
jgi:hypothetical protein